MKIEFLYFVGCPNHETALSTLKEVLFDKGLKDEVVMINIQNPVDALRHRFLGSPSIRINDIDLEITEDESTKYSMRCRRYKNGDTIEGFPSRELIRANLSAVRGLKND